MNILLRSWRTGDAAAIAAACNDPTTRRYLPLLPAPYTEADALDFIERGVNERAVVDGNSGEVLGCAGFVPRGHGVASVGYWVAPEARGRGVASTALERLGTELFEERFQRLYLEIEAENIASQRVAAAAGYVREGVARGAGKRPDGSRYDMVVWARLAGDPPGPSPRALPDLPGGRLTDGVVTLRPIGPGDATPTYNMRILPEVSGRSVVATPMDPAVVARQCAESGSRWLAGQRAEMTIRRSDDGTYLGEIALFYFEPVLREAMIGYSLVPEARGHGYATRAARLVTGWGFEIGMARMVAGTAPDNVASQRVLEAAGYHREAVQLQRLPGPGGERIDNVAFAKVRPAAT
ncbi:GNAT family N-acetyltransferase [Dactylosporangium sp. NPDC049140]|uniref:GNAT family N-acetyltransferase n=1 Tax=Dactylosporangium sp. NPDC049140 TaxID=3155647 RepID=UPI0033CF257B